MALDTNGNFTVLEAEPSPLVFVDSVTVIMTKSLPPQVSIVVRGNKSVPCVELPNPAIFRDGFSFTVALAETKMGPAETCIAIIEPFETHIRLDTVGLESGLYTVNVNGKEEGFSL
ncbi:hypothetical protein N9C14_02795 [Gammaproteobacteria bacterium]|nr:hypothetical protein [Gammaproteobacteria bacterium]MDB2376283.1 hypothetical protein [Gammaproteobacteria bacterium]